MSKNIHRLFENPLDKEVFEAYKNLPPVASTTEWASLSEKLDKHNNGRLLKKRLVSFVFLLCISAVGYYLMINTANNKETNNSLVENVSSAKSNDVSKNEVGSSLNKNATTLSSNNINADETGFEKKQKEQTISELGYNESLNTEPNANTNSSIARTKKVENFNAPKNRAVVKTIDKTQKNNASVDNNIEEKNKNAVFNESKTVLSIDKGNSTAIADKLVEVQNSIEDTTQPTTTIAIAKVANNTTVQNLYIDVSKNAIIRPEQPKIKKSKQRKERQELNIETDRTFNIEAFSGVSNSFKMQNNFAAFLAPNGYNNLRLNNETQLQSLSAGVNFSYTINKISLTTGLNFLQLGDNVNYQPVTGNNVVTNANGRTQFTYMELPFLVGTEWIKNRFSLGIKGGFTTGILTQLSGQYASHNNFNTELYDVKANKSTFRSLLINAAIAPQISYYLNEKSNLFFAPTYQRNLQSITKVDADIKQRYSILGFRLGVKSRLR